MTFESSSTAARCSSVERVGDVEHEAVADVPARGAAELGRALAAQTLDRAGLGPRLYAQSLRSVKRRHLYLSAAQGLGDRERDLDLQIVAPAREHG